MQTKQNRVLNYQAAVYRPLSGLSATGMGNGLNSGWINALSSRLLPGFYFRIHGDICLTKPNAGYYKVESRAPVCLGAWVRLHFWSTP